MNDYPNTYCLLPVGMRALEMAHPKLLRLDSEGNPVGNQADIDSLKTTNDDGTSTGAFMSLGDFIEANTFDGNCNYVLDVPNCQTHFVFQFPLSPARHPTLKLSDYDRMYAMADNPVYGLVELFDYSKALVGNEFKFMSLAEYREFKRVNPAYNVEEAT